MVKPSKHDLFVLQAYQPFHALLGLVEHGKVDMLAKQIDHVLKASPPESIPKQFSKEFLVNETVNIYELALNKAS